MRQLLIGLFILSLLTSCSEKESRSIHDEIQRLSDPPQIFNITNSKTDTIETINGSRLVIQPNSFQFADGTVPTKSIQIELKEVFDKDEMILNGLGTTSNGRLLESFGMVNIKAVSEGKELFIRRNSLLTLSIPNKKRGTQGELFYGQQDDKGGIDWKYVANADTTVRLETIIGLSGGRAQFETKVYRIKNGRRQLVSDTTYIMPYDFPDSVENKSAFYIPGSYSFEIDNLGWINCDRFIDSTANASIAIELTNFNNPAGFIVFDSLNSVVDIFFGYNGKMTIENLPANKKVTVIILDKFGDKIFWASKKMTTAETKAIRIETREIDVTELRAELKKLDRSP